MGHFGSKENPNALQPYQPPQQTPPPSRTQVVEKVVVTEKVVERVVEKVIEKIVVDETEIKNLRECLARAEDRLKKSEEKVNILQSELASKNQNQQNYVVGSFTKSELNQVFTDYFPQTFRVQVREHLSGGKRLKEKELYQNFLQVFKQVVFPLLTTPLPTSIILSEMLNAGNHRKDPSFHQLHLKIEQDEKLILSDIIDILKSTTSDPVHFLVERFTQIIREWLEMEVTFAVSNSPLRLLYHSKFKSQVLSLDNGILSDLIRLRVLMQIVNSSIQLYIPSIHEVLDETKHIEPPAFCEGYSKIHYTFWPGLQYSDSNSPVILSKAYVVTYDEIDSPPNVPNEKGELTAL